jgi:two-component system, NarL family, nitrate/nitrite response regulator NarL
LASATEESATLIDRPLPNAFAVDDPDRIRVVIVAHGPALHAGLRAMLEGAPDIDVLVERLGEPIEAPSVVLLDAAAIRLLEEPVREQWPHAHVLIVGMPDSESGVSWRESANGIVSARVENDRLIAAVRAVAGGLIVIDPDVESAPGLELVRSHTTPAPSSVTLTPRERQVLDLVARGYPNKSIAWELGITEHTAKFHVGSLLTKLNAASRAEIVTNATRTGLLTF